jgi:predicted nucleic acid-binding protein
MILIDTGPLVALVDKADKTHKKASSIFRSFKTPPLTTWACLTKAFYFIGEGCGWRGRKTLLGLLTRGSIRIVWQMTCLRCVEVWLNNEGKGITRWYPERAK